MSDILGNKYKIVREIARSNDVVYEATNIQTGRRVALKELLIPANLVGKDRRDRIERFNREARATHRLNHPNIVTVYDYGEENGRYYIAMEFLEGNTLRNILQQRTALPVKEAVDIISQLLSALSHAHSHKVIHRDIKPDNIYILPGGQVKLTDFGIARLTEEASLTADGQIFGTPSYMSPEQIVGGALDERTDIFSTGVLLYEMIAGRKPFVGDSVVTITYNIMHNDPPRIPGISNSLEMVINRAMAKEPIRRYASADEMRRDLMRADISANAMASLPVPIQPLGAGASFPQAPPSVSPMPLNTPFSSSNPLAPPGSVPPVCSNPYNGAGGAYYNPSGVYQSAAPTLYPGQTGFAPGSLPAGGAPFATTPPPLPRHQNDFQLSDSVRTALYVLMLILFISGALLGLMYLFNAAYANSQMQQKLQSLTNTYNDGVQRYQMGDYQNAARRFQYVINNATESMLALKYSARTALAQTLNSEGVLAYQTRQYSDAEQYWDDVLALYNEMPNDLSSNDQKIIQQVRDNLNQLPASTGANSDNPQITINPPPSDSMDQDLKQAWHDYYQGERDFANGNYDAAQQDWLNTIQDAPGSQPALQAANKLLDIPPVPPSSGF
jgi:serine/threonine protein kinase